MQALSRAHPREPHWFLLAIGVKPGCQGRGVADVSFVAAGITLMA